MKINAEKPQNVLIGKISLVFGFEKKISRTSIKFKSPKIEILKF